MSMLAEPRRKQKVINLRAKNNAWSNDSTKFGQRMLEKMGWSSGKGLGAHENGITEHVVARYKNDEKGLGFEDKNDQWTKHEDDFNALLANLSNASDNTENLHSGISLEDKSKKSKARIHYHKFTRGKDISRYSEKDLANIFGKKSLKNKEVIEESLKEDLKTTEQIFTEKGSMEDYFKNKLAAFKSKNKVQPEQNDTENDEPSYAFQGFSQETDEVDSSHNGFGYNSQDMNCNENADGNNFVCDSENIKKKKKKSKNKDNIETTENNSESSKDAMQQYDDNQECNGGKIKKKKKSKNNFSEDCSAETLPNEINDAAEEDTDKILKKKKKSNLKGDPCIADSTKCNKDGTNDISSTIVEEETVNGKKAKRKNDNYSPEEAVENVIQVPKKKKKKKSKD